MKARRKKWPLGLFGAKLKSQWCAIVVQPPTGLKTKRPLREIWVLAHCFTAKILLVSFVVPAEHYHSASLH
jgi:hypothetical protein